MRVGPQGLYTRMADRFVELGIPVLRFDFFGLGDSEGTLTEPLLRDVYNHIEVGRFVEDTVDSMNWMQQRGSRRFILSGLCGGAITGLLTGGKDTRVAGLLGLGITPLLASRSANPATYMTTGQLADMRRTYFSKIISPGAWLRLLTFQSDFSLIRRAVIDPFVKKVAAPAKPAAAAPPPPAEDDNANPLFPPALFEMLRSERPSLLVFGGSDRLHWEYEEKFVARHRDTLAQLPSAVDVHVIPQANHVLSLTEWQEEMLGRSETWLRTHFGRDVAGAAAQTSAQQPDPLSMAAVANPR
jgi:hypothetical protein